MYCNGDTSDDINEIIISTDYSVFNGTRTTNGVKILHHVSGTTMIGISIDLGSISTFSYSRDGLTETPIVSSFDNMGNIYDILPVGSEYVVIVAEVFLELSTLTDVVVYDDHDQITCIGDITSQGTDKSGIITIIDCSGITNNNGVWYVSDFSVLSGSSIINLTGSSLNTYVNDGNVEGMFSKGSPYYITHSLNTMWPTVAVLAKDTNSFLDEYWHVNWYYGGDIKIIDNNTIDVISVMTDNFENYYFKITK